MNNKIIPLLISILLFFPGLPKAQEKNPKETQSVSIVDVLELARENNPAIKSAREKWMGAKEKPAQASSFPDPMATFVTMKEHLQTRAGPMEEKYAIAQKFPFFGKRGLKGEMAKEEASIAEEAYKSKSLEIFSRVTRAYYDLYYLDEAIRINEELADQIRHFARVAERKYATGAQSQTSVFRAQVELAKILNDLVTLRQQRISALARLNALLSRPSREPLLPQAPREFPFESDIEKLKETAFLNRPEIRAADAMVGKSEAANSMAVREFFPDLTVGYELSKIGAGTTNTPFDGEDAEAFMFSFNVPLWYNRLVPAKREARANLASAEAMLEDWKNRTQFEVEDGVVQVETASRLIKLFNDTVLPQAEQALKSSQNGYEADRVPFLDLLDSVRMLLKFQLDYVRYQSNFKAAEAELERIVGVPLVQVSENSGRK